ncbi:MAG: TlpA disulfide reductase family protein [Bdellovibrionota bacterium]
MKRAETKTYIIGLVAAVAVIAALLLWFNAKEKDLPVNQSPVAFELLTKMEKEGVPDFELKTLDGKPVTVAEFRGKVVIVNFWASWCNPCVQEFPSMLKLVEAFKGQLIVVAVSADEEKGDIEAFAKAFGLPKDNFHIVWDADKSVMQKYGVEKIPESFLVNKDGKLIRKVLGIEDWASPSAMDYFTNLVAK